jgi:hypothetical protein
MKPIRFSNHAREQMRYRGATEQEVIEAISSAVWEPAELGRLECRKEICLRQGVERQILCPEASPSNFCGRASRNRGHNGLCLLLLTR